MRNSRIIMGMPITLDILGAEVSADLLERAFSYFDSIDQRFSTYKENSEISRINRGEISETEWSSEMREVLELAERTKRETDGYFDIRTPDGALDPSGIVKGWSIRNASRILTEAGLSNFYIDAGGDIASFGVNSAGQSWSVGIRSPFNRNEIVKVLYPKGRGVATSGTYVRGQHIYNPHAPDRPIIEIVSLTVVGPDVCEADRFATAAFAMGREGIAFIERMSEFEGYLIDSAGVATMTSALNQFTRP